MRTDRRRRRYCNAKRADNEASSKRNSRSRVSSLDVDQIFEMTIDMVMDPGDRMIAPRREGNSTNERTTNDPGPGPHATDRHSPGTVHRQDPQELPA